MKDKNWRTKVAFWLSWGCLIYLILTEGREAVIDTMATVSLTLTALFMLRSEQLTEIIKSRFGRSDV